MAFDPQLLGRAVQQVWGDKPHPDIPEIKVSQYEVFARVAAQLNQTNQPKPAQVANAYHMLTNAELAPAEFERLWEVARPLSQRLLGRDPTIHDLQALTHKMPNEVQGYYMTHPHPQYPEVSAGDMIRYYHVARPISQQLWGREPNDHELARMALAGYDANEVLGHYRDDGTAYGPAMLQPAQQSGGQSGQGLPGQSPAQPPQAKPPGGG